MFIDRFSLFPADKREDLFILAYGSNLDLSRMEGRCPKCAIEGTTVIPGYRLLFKQSRTGAYATVEQDANCSVPGVIYRIGEDAELTLDRCEGYPRYYYKREIFQPVQDLNGVKRRNRITCMAYILHENRELGEPSQEYYRLIDQAYRYWGFDPEILEKALSDSIGRKAAAGWLKKYNGRRKA